MLSSSVWGPPQPFALLYCWPHFTVGFPGGSNGEESACNAGDPGPIPGSGRSPGGGHGYLLQCLPGEFTDRGAWQAIVHGAAKSQTWLSSIHFTSSHFTVTMYLLVSHTRWLWQELWLLFIWLILRCVDRCAKLTLVFMTHESGQDPTPIFIHLLSPWGCKKSEMTEQLTHTNCVFICFYPHTLLPFFFFLRPPLWCA